MINLFYASRLGLQRIKAYFQFYVGSHTRTSFLDFGHLLLSHFPSKYSKLQVKSRNDWDKYSSKLWGEEEESFKLLGSSHPIGVQDAYRIW